MSAQAMPEPAITLPEEDRVDLSGIIHENVLGVTPAPEFLDALLEKEPYLIEEGIKWGFHDTVVRENVASHCSQWLIGRRWPLYGDKLSDEEFKKFVEDVKTSYDKWVTEHTK